MSRVRWEEISEAAKDFVSQLLVVEPRTRMTGEATVTQARLVMGLDNGEAGDNGLELEE